MLVSSCNLSQSFNYASYLFLKKRFKSEVNCFCIRTQDNGMTTSESIEWLIEEQAFSPSFDMAPPPLPPYLPSLCSTHRKTEERTCWRERGKRGGGEEPNYTTPRKPGPLHSALSRAVYSYTFYTLNSSSWIPQVHFLNVFARSNTLKLTYFFILFSLN